ncbi:DUF418 domain-containing protein [Actinoplanes teichomyceticus]|uniref:DUF418 domain-containing protein n=1 Tax=Actinoplanes teichomyceticus TaxID=1867 RepID=A0A561VCR0_ACTTI|nr:DUF418 domain-containing protein [Actinoplanes teichomyceticus]TWG09393.1 uncharacterized protein FHX34_108108 [Actinoplanes teichomyceticus]GIF17024.1 hypothetical protein Ate01nite_70560 [Actinoplanes teichomyceticus]
MTAAPPLPRTAPEPATSRIGLVDALRGFALFGILAVNITYFGSPFQGTGIADPAHHGALDTAVHLAVTALFETKFFLLFSFLFGYSFTLQMDSAARRGARITRRFPRRLAGLFVIGAAHAVLLFPGDILTTYALLGVVLLVLRRLRPRRALWVAAGLLVLAAAAYALLAIALHASGGAGGPDPAAAGRALATGAAYRGGPGEVIAQHLRDLPDTAALLLLFQAPAALAMFLAGLAAGTRRALADAGRHRRRLRWIMVAGLSVGLPAGALYAYVETYRAGTPAELAVLALDLLAAPALAAAYGAAVLLAGTARPRLAAALAPAGRMALSNYLFQSLVCSLLFTGYGAALTGRLGPPAVFAVAVALFAVQLPLSAWWLRRHRYGPVEWLLRMVTNAEVPPWRITR